MDIKNSLTSTAAAMVEKLKWGVQQRLAFIESRLFWEDSVNRADLMGTFDISVPQASNDLSLYQELAPGNLRYDGGRKRYVPTDGFAPRFAELDPDRYLRELAERTERNGGEAAGLVVERLPVPQRHINSRVLRQLVAAAKRGLSLDVLYEVPEPANAAQQRRRISPHAFAHDGVRWHVRAYCHREARFRDFIVSRCLEAAALTGPGESAAGDHFWNDRFPVVLAPNPRLTPAEQEMVCRDYQMTMGQVVIEVRRALLYHFNKRLRLDMGDVARPREAPVIVQNRAEYEAAIAEAYGRPD